MGIVMTISMFFGLLALTKAGAWSPLYIKLASGLLIVSGLWNTFWYGIAHIEQFWGQAAFVSGVIMLGSAIHLLRNKPSPENRAASSSTLMTRLLQISLFACFLLYAITLLQLNLGYQIIA